MALAMAVGALSARKPGSGFAPCEIGSPARRPFGVAPRSLPIAIVEDHENHPGIRFRPPGVGPALTSSVNRRLTRSAQASPSDPPRPNRSAVRIIARMRSPAGPE